ncbi:9159_t:CDS:2 [Gigaspora rosea]|nr:9159_t:CDS:2 [Gigaspora rosea]
MANLQEWFGARKDLLLIKFDDLGQLTFIDRGAFGEVYSTQISSFGEKVAVKKVFKSYLGDSSTSKGFIKELKLHSQLEKHERIINFLGICEHPKEACFLLIIEFADENSSQFSMAVKTENNSFYGEYKCENHIKNNNWCHHCEVENFKQQFSNWTSNNSIINRSIRNLQLNFTKSFNDLKWIQFNRLINIKEHENATSILEAEWIDEPMDLWNKDYEKLGRSGSTKIVIKKSSEIADIINEVKLYILFDDILKCFGLTHISGKQQYGIILPLASEGDLRKYMKKKFPLELKQELHVLQGIVNGLKSIHDLNYVHADIHPGNVVINVEMGELRAYIIDFGESRPVSARPQEINENMPFMAPEVIKGQGYTKTGDIYSLGMLMFEISFGHPPFIDRKYDVHLALDICNGLRPSFDPKLPKFYADLIVRCWNTDPSERPTINEVKQLIDSWCRNKK